MLSTKFTSHTGYKQQRFLDLCPFKPKHPDHPSPCADSVYDFSVKGKIVVRINKNIRCSAQMLLLLYFLLVT